MQSNTTIFLLALAIIFIGLGDSFLPDPLAKASYNARSEINEIFLGLFPDTENIGNFGSDES